MSPDNDACRLLMALSATLDQALSWNAGHECVLLFDNEVEVAITALPVEGLLSVRSPVMHLGGTSDEARLWRALALNYGGVPPGQALAIDEVTNQLALATMFAPALTASEGFVSAVLQMADAVPALQAELSR